MHHRPDRLPARRSPAGSRRWLATLIACAVGATGCATQPVTDITLSGVVRGGAAVSGPAPTEAVTLVRNGMAQAVAADMRLQAGDAIRTGPDAAVVVSYPGGARAYIFPDTRARIGSIFDEIGKVFVKVKGAFKVGTTYVTAASEGTQYWVDVAPGDAAKVVVVEGQVGVSSNTGAWPSQTLGPGQQMLVRAGTPLQKGPADPAELKRHSDAVKSLDSAVPVKTSLSPWGAAAIGIAIGIGIKALADKDDDRDNDSPSTPEVPGTRPGGGTPTGGTDGSRDIATPPVGTSTVTPGRTTTAPPAASSSGTAIPTQPRSGAILRRTAPIVLPRPEPSGPVVK